MDPGDRAHSLRWLNKWPTWVGFAFTVLWFAAIGFYISQRPRSLWDLQANAFGDFLAGAFAPPAFVWLIMGYLLQARELSLQVKELAQHVQATDRVAKAAIDDLRSHRVQHGPFLHCYVFNRFGPGHQARIKVANNGHTPAIQLQISQIKTGAGLEVDDFRKDILRVAEEDDFRVKNLAPGEFAIIYRDVWGEHHEVWFETDNQNVRRRRAT
jgi:hypothetical protein